MKIETLAFDEPKAKVSAATKKILVAHGLDFIIHKLPLTSQYTTEDNQGIIQLDTPYFGLYHSKTHECLNVTKETYRVSQNEELVDLALNGAKGFGNLSITKAGALDGGRKVYIQLAIEGDAKVGKDTIKRYVTIIDSNDGSTGLSIGVGDLTMSCQNQFYRFYKAGEMKIRHRQLMTEKIKEVPALIALALSESMKLVNAYQTFQKTKASKALVDDLVKTMLGMDRQDAKQMDLTAQNSKRINNMEKLYGVIGLETKDKGMNLWGLHSGITRWTTHEKQAPDRDSGRLEGIIMSNGTNYEANQKSLKFALKHAGIKL